jgi:hypothetical protein
MHNPNSIDDEPGHKAPMNSWLCEIQTNAPDQSRCEMEYRLGKRPASPPKAKKTYNGHSQSAKCIAIQEVGPKVRPISVHRKFGGHRNYCLRLVKNQNLGLRPERSAQHDLDFLTSGQPIYGPLFIGSPATHAHTLSYPLISLCSAISGSKPMSAKCCLTATPDNSRDPLPSLEASKSSNCCTILLNPSSIRRSRGIHTLNCAAAAHQSCAREINPVYTPYLMRISLPLDFVREALLELLSTDNHIDLTFLPRRGLNRGFEDLLLLGSQSSRGLGSQFSVMPVLVTPLHRCSNQSANRIAGKATCVRRTDLDILCC